MQNDQAKRPTQKFIRPKTIILLILMPIMTMAAQDFFRRGRELQNNIQDDKAAKSELDRIHGLKISTNQALLSKELDQTQAEVDAYTAYLESGKAIKEKRDTLHAKDPDVLKSIESVTVLAKDCKKTTNVDALDSALFSLKSYFEGSDVDLDFGMLGNSLKPDSPDDEQVVTKVSRILRMDGRGLCKEVAAHQLDVVKLKQDLLRSVSIADKEADAQVNDYEKKAPRAQQLLTAWTERKAQLEKALEQQAGTASTVANYLPYIIGGFCIFALLIFLILMRFPEKSQMELISSGQVIQFATVMVLLIVVCILGMAKFITDSTLGTLLGGISGYVLSQGVGRSERHSATTNPPKGG